MRRICLTNKASQLGDDFVYSYDLCEEFDFIIVRRN